MQEWVHNETFQDVSTKVPIPCHAASVTYSRILKDKRLPLDQHNMPPTQCMICENCFTSRPKWWNTWILQSPYVFIISFCTDILRTSTTSMPYIKIWTEVTHYVDIPLAFLLMTCFLSTQTKNLFPGSLGLSKYIF